MTHARSKVALLVLLAIGCGGGGGGTDSGMIGNDTGSADPVLYDDEAPTSCATTSCPAGTVLTACVCTPVSFGAGF